MVQTYLYAVDVGDDFMYLGLGSDTFGKKKGEGDFDGNLTYPSVVLKRVLYDNVKNKDIISRIGDQYTEDKSQSKGPLLLPLGKLEHSIIINAGEFAMPSTKE